MKPKSPPLLLRLVSKLNETFCLVGKVFGVPVNSRVIRHRLKSEWKNLQGEVSIDHIGRDWYKVEFNAEVDVFFVLDNRPWFVQGQIFNLQRWTPDFSPFYAVVTSIVGWVRIPFLPLHYKDPEVLYDLVSILGDPISVDLQSTEGKQIMFVRAHLVLDLTRPLKRCLVLGEHPQETIIFVSYEALFAICFYCSQKMERDHICPIKISNKSFLMAFPSKGKGRAVVIAPAHSQEGSSAFTGFAYKSPKKRTRDEVEVEENYAPSVEMHGEYLRETEPLVDSHERFIHCHIQDLIDQKNWKATFVYAYP
ncbi:hypothetical protein PRUPE_2G036800 [Prunus persica]|uniref:DUF4283 domain-containing protein n=1 Tax=Prunus persica TaxID=3760 RepID=A0A251QDU5_PRUPE|nr:hypothetical protein PRUPE_2G036800 [Prunus persica]